MDSIIARTEAVIKENGFTHFGFTKLQKPMTFSIYQEWLNQSLNGTMTYLNSHAATKEFPQNRWPQAHSAIVVAQPYYPHPVPAELPINQSRVALYAKGKDYHHWFLEKLKQLIQTLQKHWPNDYFTAVTDSQPLLERDLAYRAGLGWVGKNTCVIHQGRGSLFFIGEILTSLSLNAPEVLHPDRCGTCTRCLDICPTQALIAPRKLDARRCISYLTIEAKDDPPKDLRPLMGDWLFGCDLCQTVCPWNEKAFHINQNATLSNNNDLKRELEWILLTSGKQLQKALRGTALLRAGSHKLKRSALIVIANLKLTELAPQVTQVAEQFPRLKELATWTLSKLEENKNVPHN